MAARARLVAQGRPCRPVFVKIAPDIPDDEIDAICASLTAHEVDAIAVSNTTLSRAGVTGLVSREGGGLSGAPLFHRSTVMLARVYIATGGRIPLVGIGGITSPQTALAKIEAGASLVQLYTGLIYEGPGLIGRIKRGLIAAVDAADAASISALVGRNATAWAAQPLDAASSAT
jgi:dihydroorotate dehydrogenase